MASSCTGDGRDIYRQKRLRLWHLRVKKLQAKPIDMHAKPLWSAVVLQQLAGTDECLQTKSTSAFPFHYLFHFKCQSGTGVLTGGRSQQGGGWEALGGAWMLVDWIYTQGQKETMTELWKCFSGNDKLWKICFKYTFQYNLIMIKFHYSLFHMRESKNYANVFEIFKVNIKSKWTIFIFLMRYSSSC